jgi:small ligand-binding sensory domain FIST
MPNSAASRLVLASYSEQSVIETASAALRDVGGKASCAFAFCSSDYRENLSDFMELLQLHARAPIVAGCSASGVISSGGEHEKARGFSMLLLHLPETEITQVVLPGSRDAATDFIPTETMRAADAWIVLANPLAEGMEPWLDSWNSALPGVPCIGGLASSAAGEADIFTWSDRAEVDGGIALGLKGGVRVDALVSQGCRPIGEPWSITGAERNYVITLGSRPAFEVLQETFQSLPNSEKEQAQGNIFVGLATSEYVDEFKTGDFLIRNLLGGDPKHGVIAVGAWPRVGQTLQFQLRDANSADAELRHLTEQRRTSGRPPFASLLFACNGRGRHLFGTPDHDAAVLAETLGAHPSAGFFCNGEIGPVGGRNFIHGYTASAALFSDA